MSYKSFKETDRIDEALARNDMVGVRELLCVACKVDKTFQMFSDGCDYVTKEKGRADLWEDKLDETRKTYGKRVDEKNPKLSDADYSDAVFDLSRNFCEGRAKDVEKLSNYLYGKDKKNKSVESTASKKAASENPPLPAQEKRKRLLPAIIAIVALVVVIGALALMLRKLQ